MSTRGMAAVARTVGIIVVSAEGDSRLVEVGNSHSAGIAGRRATYATRSPGAKPSPS